MMGIITGSGGIHSTGDLISQDVVTHIFSQERLVGVKGMLDPLAAQQGPHSERRADSLNGGLQLLSLGHKQPCNNPGRVPASRACAKAARCRAVHVGLGHLRLNVGGCRNFLLRRKKRC